jgi:hypothetical protein
MPQLGKMLIVAGLGLVVLGLLVWVGGKLPGNFTWRTKNTTVYFPLATCLLASAIGTLILWLLNRR